MRTYQAILEEGIEKGVLNGERRLLLTTGRQLGKPFPDVVEALNRIESSERLERMAERLLEVESWDELLAG